MTTPNKGFNLPANGSDVDTWDVPVNANSNIADTAFGSTATINVTGISGTVALTLAQYQCAFIVFTGTLTADVIYQVPASVGGFWVVTNSATGAHTITISSAGAGRSSVAVQGGFSIVKCDATNVDKYAAAAGVNGDITQLTALAVALSIAQGGTGATTASGAAANLAVLALAGGTMTGELVTAASAIGGAGLNLPQGSAPTSPANGDFWATSSGFFGRIAGVTVGPLGQSPQIIEVQNKQATGGANTEAGFTTSTWNNRVLNTTIRNTVSGASLSGNRVTLPAGTYSVTVTGTPFASTAGLAVYAANRLFDYTNSALLVSLNTFSNFAGTTVEPVLMDFSGTFTLAGTAAVGLDFYLNTGSILTYGVSVGASGTPEVYTDVVFTKIA